ncbi:MAG: DUF3109 family protein [Prevotellaceae bacterium]|jgi:hypothetical protein|nr:DUF3109 family protein [Prevotellaceae bacterium]
MLQIDDKIVSVDLLRKYFCCDLGVCAGVCCVHGDSGAPLDAEEEKILQRELKNFLPYLTEKGRSAVAEQGVAVVDSDGDLVTPLVPNSEECAYSYFNKEGVCLCAIEQAFFEGKTEFRKPISCHLYPIRIKKLGDNLALNYDCWSICQCARDKGKDEGVPVFRFLKEAITRRFGKGFYAQLEEAYTLLNLT